MDLRRARHETFALLLLGLGAWVVRASPFFRADGVLGWVVDSDEGVYLSAAMLAWRGVVPYRDFVFVHPPGIIVALGPLMPWGLTPNAALEAARWLIVSVGALNVVLAAFLVRRRAGFWAACVTAGLLAVWPELVAVDRGVHLEPFLSALCLAALWKLDREPPKTLSAGALFGLALWMKSWAVLWLAAWLLTRGRRAVPGLVAALIIGVLGFLPGLVVASDFLTQVVGIHLVRPPDGDLGALVRLREMFVTRSVLPLVLLLAGARTLWRRRDEPLVRLLVVVAALLVAAFVSAAAYWNQYNAHLAIPLAVLAGIASASFIPAVVDAHRARVVFGVLVAALVGVPGLVWVLDRRRDQDEEQIRRVARLKELIPKHAALCAFEPTELVMAGRTPAVLSTTRTLVDPYGQMLLDAARDGARSASANEAFQSEASQQTVRTQLAECPAIVLGWRGNWQLNAATKAQIDAHKLVE